MKFCSSALAVLAALAMKPSTSSAFSVPIPKSGGSSPTAFGITNTARCMENWHYEKPPNHPDYSLHGGNNIELTPPPRFDEESREVARLEVAPLAESETGENDDAFSEEEQRQKEDAMLEEYRKEDAQLNALMEEAKMLAEEVRLRAEEEMQYMPSQEDLDAWEAEREAMMNYDEQHALPPMITDAQDIRPPDEREPNNYKIQPTGNYQNGDDDIEEEDELAELSPEEQYEAEMKQKGIDEAKRQTAAVVRMREEQAAAKAEMKQRGIDEAKRLKTAAARMRAEKEQARVQAEIEARKKAIDAAQRYADPIEEERYSKEQDIKMKGVEEARRRNAEAARLRAEQEEERILAQANNRAKGIEAARRMREEAARRLEEEQDKIYKQREEARRVASERVSQRIKEQEAQLAEREPEIDPKQVNFSVDPVRSDSEVVTAENKAEEEEKEEEEGTKDGGDAPRSWRFGSKNPEDRDDKSDDGPDDKPPAIGDLMRIIG